ncbi:MAG: hypothetical protein ACREF1_12825 [Acetobacteraceae bacterium]
MTHQTLLSASAAVVIAAGAANAGELHAIEGRSIALGPVTGMVYFVHQGADDDVVATLRAGTGNAIVRFEASLSPGQSAIISVPRGPGEAAIAIRIRRQGERIFLTRDITS